MMALAMRGASATLPRPTRPVSVSISTTVQPWKRKVLIVSCGEWSRSIALEQKLPCGGTGRPLHLKTRARTEGIFIRCFLGGMSVDVDAGGLDELGQARRLACLALRELREGHVARLPARRGE